MNRFVLLRQWRWRTESSQYAIYLENIPKDNPTPASSQSTWCVDELVPMVDGRYAKSPGRGIILASEKILGSTIVEFIDGVWGANFLDDTPIEDDFLTLIEILMAEWGNKDTKTQGLISQDYLPQEPITRDLMNDWFPYFHKVRPFKKITLKDIATKTQYTYDYVRELHSRYVKSLEE